MAETPISIDMEYGTDEVLDKPDVVYDDGSTLVDRVVAALSASEDEGQ